MTQQKDKETEGGAPPRLPMDIKLIKNLVELMVENDLSRIELREGDSHILLRRGHPVVASAGTQVLSPGYAVPSAAAGNPGTPAGASPAAAEVAKEASIRSPMVGTFYAAAEPEAPPYVSAGSVVTPDTVVCLIEAMKVFNEIKAEVSGRITKVLVKNAEAVEFDQPLFAIAPE